jgi:hypothetical protein
MGVAVHPVLTQTIVSGTARTCAVYARAHDDTILEAFADGNQRKSLDDEKGSSGRRGLVVASIGQYQACTLSQA